MHYIFVINNREDKRWISAEVDRQIHDAGPGLDYEIYKTVGIGDATRFVRIYCDLHPRAECCFVACGGSGTVNEVASGMVGFENKYLAILAYGETNDFTKYYPDRDFRSLRNLLAGEPRKIDIIKVNDSYSINVINVGFEAVVAAKAYMLSESGRPGDNVNRGILYALLNGCRNRIRVEADGERMNHRRLFLCTLSNCRWIGGRFLCAPYADNEDGLIEFSLVRRMSWLMLLLFLPHYERGEQFELKPWKRMFIYRRVRSVTLNASSLIDICLDGEMLSGHSFDIRILPKEINLILPSVVSMKKRFEPIMDKCGEIVDYLMSSPDIPQDSSLRFKIRLSVEEAVENVVRYAYEGGVGWIEVGTGLDPEGVMLTILLKDAGVPFNPLDKPDPDVTLSAEERQIGGLGIFLCKKLMDHIEYKYEDGCNVLTMTKKIA
ncbi:MAG: ATP-binding protein [Bacteroidales bacterium]|nr:ATP-binding protein [Bacteroidales bacterium]